MAAGQRPCPASAKPTPAALVPFARGGASARRQLNRTLGLNCEHFGPVADHGSRYMLRQLLQQDGFARLLGSAASCAILALGLCSCQTEGTSDITGSLGEKTEASRAADPRGEVNTYRERFHANPKDADAALQYGKALRATGQRSQAVAVLEQAAIAHPGLKALLARD